jgi:hypothetical protein
MRVVCHGTSWGEKVFGMYEGHVACIFLLRRIVMVKGVAGVGIQNMGDAIEGWMSSHPVHTELGWRG